MSPSEAEDESRTGNILMNNMSDRRNCVLNF